MRGIFGLNFLGNVKFHIFDTLHFCHIGYVFVVRSCHTDKQICAGSPCPEHFIKIGHENISTTFLPLADSSTALVI